jgi:hypothetical protein
MATTTPNFGWPVPTSSDLVKNGATAIEGLGDAIDASLLDLKGGTTGQVLAKASNTDMDFSWVVQDDANAIQNTQLTAKGALISAVSAGTPATLTVGTNNQVLTADSTTATGLKWATPSASTPTLAGCRAVKSALQSIPNATYTSVTFAATDTYDTNSFHDPVTNSSRITIPTGGTGYYQIFGQITWVAASNHLGIMSFLRNGSDVLAFNLIGTGNSSTQQAQFMSDVRYLTAGDYIEIQVYQNVGSAINVQGSASDNQSSFFGVNFLGA